MPFTDPAVIELLVLDVDGVLTDGRVTLGSGELETKSFSTRDGFGLTLWRRAGLRSAIITGRTSEAVERRAAELRIDDVVQGSTDKLADLKRLCARRGIELSRVAFIGDDWPDLPPMRAVGLPVAVADAEPELRARAAYVTPRPGGRGAVRDAVNHLLGARGALAELLARYDQTDTTA